MAFRSVTRIPRALFLQKTFNRSISIAPSKWGRFKSSEKFESIDRHPEVQVIENPPEWKYVEYLIGKPVIPVPEVKESYPSGWQPQDPEKYKHLPYYIKRNRNHMLPVYLKTRFRGMRRDTFIRRIEGDIWQLEQDCIRIIKERIGNNPVYTQINEMNRLIKIKGDYVTLLQKFFYKNGL